ncbi:MAG: cysteine synthase family protein [Anaerolineales bacterium]
MHENSPQSALLTLPAQAESLLSMVGNTPIQRLTRVSEGLAPEVELWVKAEWFNPAGSVKDRPARGILLRALEQGLLGEGHVLLDSTSGNMGIAYATFAAALDVRVHLAVPANAGPARLGHLRALGAELTLTDPLEGSDGARVVAAGMADSCPDLYFYADQYSNPENWKAHYSGTGPELMAQTEGRITHFVCGLGTTGTMTGAGRFFHEASPDTSVIAVQPDGPLHGLEGLKHLTSSPVPPIFDDTIADETRPVSTEQAYEMARQLARREGLLVGASGGACVWAALEIARTLQKGVVVALIPDSGLKYLDTPLWNLR